MIVAVSGTVQLNIFHLLEICSQNQLAEGESTDCSFFLLFRLKQQEDKKHFPDSQEDFGSQLQSARTRQVNESLDDYLARLIEERDTLLRTGVYNHEDHIVSELDRQISELLAKRSSSKEQNTKN